MIETLDSVASRILSRLGLFRLATVFVRFSHGAFGLICAKSEKWLNLAEREGFIPLPEVHEIKRFSNIPEYPYLRKYPPGRTQLCPLAHIFLAQQ